MSNITDKALSLLKLQKQAEVKTPPTGVKGWPTYQKIGLPLSAAGLGLSVYNTFQANRVGTAELQKVDLEKKSLNALMKIHKTLATNPHPEKI